MGVSGAQVDCYSTGGIDFTTSAAFVAPSAIAAHSSITGTTKQSLTTTPGCCCKAQRGLTALFFALISGSAAIPRQEAGPPHAAAARLDGSARDHGSPGARNGTCPFAAGIHAGKFLFDRRTTPHAACN